jgi:hypothetical protein
MKTFFIKFPPLVEILEKVAEVLLLVCQRIGYLGLEDVKLDAKGWWQTRFSLPKSLQLRVLRLGLFVDRDIGVGVFPEREEVFLGSERPDAGGIGIRSLPPVFGKLSTAKHWHAPLPDWLH